MHITITTFSHYIFAVMPPGSKKASSEATSRKLRRKRARPQTQANSDDDESPQKKASDVANAMLKLRLAGVETELRDTQEKYELTCLEHQSALEEKDRAIVERDNKIAELEHRLYYAEMSVMDHQFYGGHAPHFYYAEEKCDKQELPQQQAPRLLSRRGR